jgi:hypothetical protein
MNEDLAKALDMRPLNQIAVAEQEVLPALIDDIEDPFFEQANQDAQMVRNNLLKLIDDGAELFDDVKAVALNTQDPEQYAAAARMFSEQVKVNKELMNIHKDVFGMKPRTEPKQEAETINNVFFTGSASDVMNLLRENGIGKRKRVTRDPVENGKSSDT